MVLSGASRKSMSRRGQVAKVTACRVLAAMSVAVATWLVLAGAADAASLPSVPQLTAPAVDATAVPVVGASLSARFADPDAADTGTIGFQVCLDPGCGSPAMNGTSASGLANGT